MNDAGGKIDWFLFSIRIIIIIINMLLFSCNNS